MSIIQQQRDEIERLTAEKLQTEKDMAFVANTFKEAWDALGIDFSSMNLRPGEKPGMMDMTRMSLSIGKKLFNGKIKIEDLVKKWEAVAPVLEKYQHVLESNKLQ